MRIVWSAALALLCASCVVEQVTFSSAVPTEDCGIAGDEDGNGLAECADSTCADAPSCARASCADGRKDGSESDVDCGGACPSCALGRQCARDLDCTTAGVCDPRLCRAVRSCAEVLRRVPGASDGVYLIAPEGSFPVLCDMARDGGGWTLLLKSNSDETLAYFASAWSDAALLNETDLTTQTGNAKYQSFLSLPVATLRGELDGFRFTQSFAGLTAQQIFAGQPAIVDSFPTFNTGAPNWSAQANCHTFGVNIPYPNGPRFGWSANQENDCLSNDTAIGLGLPTGRGAGYRCPYTDCSGGLVDAGGAGLLWAK
jgi:Fibrinogen beta and gamma chains, C-terminal globular domain